MFWRKKRPKKYVSWERYAAEIDVWNTLAFTQRTRLESVRNMPGLGATEQQA